MIDLFLNIRDKELLSKSEQVNNEEMLSWKLPNLIFPIMVIFVSMVCFLLFKNSDNKNLAAFVNLLLNGSLPMVALNRLSSLGINLFKFDKTKETSKSKNNTYNLRLTIHYYSQGLVFCIAIFYIFQVINLPFDLSWTMLIQIVLGILCIEQSLKVSKYAFLLQEKLIDSTFDVEVRQEIQEKGHGKNWE